jgi:hypothetical protein
MENIHSILYSQAVQYIGALALVVGFIAVIASITNNIVTKEINSTLSYISYFTRVAALGIASVIITARIVVTNILTTGNPAEIVLNLFGFAVFLSLLTRNWGKKRLAPESTADRR